MPLPSNGEKWPPPRLHRITPQLDEWSAWYSGDPDQLDAAYQPGATGVKPRPSQYRGGVVGSIARWFWGKPLSPFGGGDRIRLHVPIAADLCQASSDLLFADPPTITAKDDVSNARVEVFIEDGMIAALAQAAEVIAALGGGYLRVTWDETVALHPFTTVIDADAALPEFRYGRLSAVTFWQRWNGRGQEVWRKLERHETDPITGNGVIEHGLYLGTEDLLGRRQPLDAHPETEMLARLVNQFSQIDTGSPGLAVQYVPNLRPNRIWRNDPLGRNLGRSDLAGIEPLMDNLDRVYSSWMRDVDLGKGRVIVPEFMLEGNGPGRGVSFDYDRDIFTPIVAAPSAEGANDIKVVQFAIRVAEHQQTAQQLVEDILRSSGYSAQTFGEDETGGAATATEITSRDRRSALTRDRKIREWRPAITEHVRKTLLVDASVFNSGANPEGLEVKFNDSAQDTPLQLATTAEMLTRAKAASVQTLVRLVHPDWQETEVDDEAARIKDELGLAPVADPAAIGVGGLGLDPVLNGSANGF